MTLFSVLDRENTPHMWRSEEIIEGKKPHGWYRVYGSVCTGFQYMYMGCSGNNRVCTHVVVGIATYVRGFQ